MFNKLANLWLKKKTKGYTEMPLVWITFNLPKYLSEGAENSCIAHFPVECKDDELLKELIGDVIDYIRDNYDMEQICKI